MHDLKNEVTELKEVLRTYGERLSSHSDKICDLERRYMGVIEKYEEEGSRREKKIKQLQLTIEKICSIEKLSAIQRILDTFDRVIKESRYWMEEIRGE